MPMALLSNEAESLREVEKLPNKVAANVKVEALAREALSVVESLLGGEEREAPATYAAAAATSAQHLRKPKKATPALTSAKTHLPMSTMPPKKGKKRQEPPTPSGKPPPAKGRPGPATFDTSGRLSPLQGDFSGNTFPPADPFAPGAPTQGASSATPTSGEQTAPMDTGDSEPAFAIPTVTTEIDDAEAESSFKELQDWTRYIAQHPGQRARLLHFTAEVQDLQLEAIAGRYEFLCSTGSRPQWCENFFILKA